MNEQFFDRLKRELDIRIKPKLRDGKTQPRSQGFSLEGGWGGKRQTSLIYYTQDFRV